MQKLKYSRINQITTHVYNKQEENNTIRTNNKKRHRFHVFALPSNLTENKLIKYDNNQTRPFNQKG